MTIMFDDVSEYLQLQNAERARGSWVGLWHISDNITWDVSFRIGHLVVCVVAVRQWHGTKMNVAHNKLMSDRMFKN